MKTKRSMKILVEDNLDDIIVELDRLGYEKSETFTGINSAITTTQKNGSFTDWSFNTLKGLYETTLSELKEM